MYRKNVVNIHEWGIVPKCWTLKTFDTLSNWDVLDYQTWIVKVLGFDVYKESFSRNECYQIVHFFRKFRSKWSWRLKKPMLLVKSTQLSKISYFLLLCTVKPSKQEFGATINRVCNSVVFFVCEREVHLVLRSNQFLKFFFLFVLMCCCVAENQTSSLAVGAVAVFLFTFRLSIFPFFSRWSHFFFGHMYFFRIFFGS